MMRSILGTLPFEFALNTSMFSDATSADAPVTIGASLKSCRTVIDLALTLTVGTILDDAFQTSGPDDFFFLKLAALEGANVAGQV